MKKDTLSISVKYNDYKLIVSENDSRGVNLNVVFMSIILIYLPPYFQSILLLLWEPHFHFKWNVLSYNWVFNAKKNLIILLY